MKKNFTVHLQSCRAFSWLAVLFLCLACLPNLSAQTTLGPGDLVFVGYNASDDQVDGSNSNEKFSFVLLKDITSGTKIYFTDFGWLTGGGFQKSWVAGPENGGSGTGSKDDGIISWTATSNLAAGTQVVIHPKYLLGTSAGTVAGVETVSGQSYFMNLADIAGDQLFAYQAATARDASPTLLAGLMILQPWSATLSNTEYTPSRSTLPTALTAGGLNAALNNYSATFELNFRALSIYSCSVNEGFPSSLRNAINTLSAWNIPHEGTACAGYLYQPNPAQDCYQPGIPAGYDLPISCVFTVLQVKILTHPVADAACSYEQATFSASAQNAQTYQWQGMPSGGSWSNLTNGAVYSGVNTTTLTVLNTAGLNGWQYRMLAEEPIEPSSVASNAATLTVNEPPQNLSLTASSSSFCPGSSVILTAASSTANTNFSFSGPNGAINPLPGNPAAIEVHEAGEFTVKATAPNGCFATTSTTINLSPQPTAALSGSTIIDPGGSATLSVALTGTAPWELSYTDGSSTTVLNILLSELSGDVYSFNVSPAITTTYTLTAVSDANCSGTVSGSATISIAVIDPFLLGPISGLPVDPIPINAPAVSASASFTGSGLISATWTWGDGSTSPAVENGTSLTGSHVYTTAGVYTVELTAYHTGGDPQTVSYQYVVVFDPNGGFVTGGGWFYSLPGAYVPEPQLEGVASFGFVSKYQKGATLPKGTTEFEFRAGNLYFQSTQYEWLVIAGAKASYKGVGTINGLGSYKFLLSAVDEARRNSSTSTIPPDKIRIKIWTESGDVETVIYDSQLGDGNSSNDALDAEAATAIGGGAIVIHDGKSRKNAREATDTGIPANFSAYPVPLSAEGLWLAFPAMKQQTAVKAYIYDISGRVLAEKAFVVEKDGSSLLWEVEHQNWSAGMYLLLLKSQDFTHQVKLLK